MTDPAPVSVIRRKAGALRDPFTPGVMSVARAWHMTMPRVSDEVAGLQLAVRAVQERAMFMADLLSEVQPTHLIALMQGAEGRMGLALLDPPLLTGVIEVQMTGRVGSAAVIDRVPTPTDAAIAAGLVDAWCVAFDEAAADMTTPSPCAGARFAAHLPDARSALLTLAEGEFRVMRLSLDLGSGARQGSLTLAMPVSAPAVSRKPGGADREEPLGVALGRILMDSPAAMEVVLHRFRLPYAAIRDMVPGDTVEIPLAALTSVSVETPDGRHLARARLGQVDGRKAICLDLGEAARKATGTGFAAASGRQAPSVPAKEPPDTSREISPYSVDRPEPAALDDLPALSD
jgi:flagellar motor switch protein FliM